MVHETKYVLPHESTTDPGIEYIGHLRYRDQYTPAVRMFVHLQNEQLHKLLATILPFGDHDSMIVWSDGCRYFIDQGPYPYMDELIDEVTYQGIWDTSQPLIMQLFPHAQKL